MTVVGREPLEKARSLAREALAAGRGTDPEQALDACDHALNLLLPVGPSDALADVLRWKGTILRDRGNHTAAADLYAQSLAVADAIEYRDGRAHALNCLGTISQLRGDLRAAERWYGEAARLAHRLADRRLTGMVQQNLGILAEVQQRTDEAVTHFRLALAAFELEDQNDAVIWVLNNLGVLYTRESAFARAQDVLERALTLAKSLNDVASEAMVQENRARLFLATGRLDQADAAVVRALTIAEQRHDNSRRASAFRLLAQVTAARKPGTPDAIVLLDRALVLCELGEDVELRAEILSDLGDACRDSGEMTRARECWRRAIEIARIAGFGSMIGKLVSRLRSPAFDRNDGASQATAP